MNSIPIVLIYPCSKAVEKLRTWSSDMPTNSLGIHSLFIFNSSKWELWAMEAYKASPPHFPNRFPWQVRTIPKLLTVKINCCKSWICLQHVSECSCSFFFHLIPLTSERTNQKLLTCKINFCESRICLQHVSKCSCCFISNSIVLTSERTILKLLTFKIN